MPHKNITVEAVPYWTERVPLPRFPRLERDLEVEVVVIGGGITGLTAAYLLSLEGRSVALLERGRLAGIDTGHTTAHLTMVSDRRLVDLSKSLGRNHAQAVWDSGLAAIAQIETIIREQDLACDFEWVPGYLYLDQTAASKSNDQQLKQEAAIASDQGIDASYVDDVPFMQA